MQKALKTNVTSKVQKEEKQANEHLFTTCSFETFSEALQS
jgi:hypothetical protein